MDGTKNVMNRLARCAPFVVAVLGLFTMILPRESVAQTLYTSKVVWENDAGDQFGIPATLTSSNVTFTSASDPQDPTWYSSSEQNLPAYPTVTATSPYFQGQQSGSHLPNRSAKSGTGLDSLPSFRGIKGIKNLPGGVGTLLMSNPHVGVTWYPEQSTDQAGTTLSMERYYFQGAVPVYSKGPDTWLLTAHLDATKVNTNAILPTTMQAFPTQLFNVAFGANYFHQFEGGKVGGIIFDVGTASDKPFESGRDILASGTGFLLTPRDDVSSWFVGVHASTNSQVLYGIPIPGGGLYYHPSEDFQAIVGFPFSLFSWNVTRDWQLQYVYAFLTTMHARAVYQPTNDWQIYAGFDWTNENWRRAERVDERAHFFYYEKKLATGFLWWFRPNVGLEISGGYAFDRYFTEVDGFKLVGDNTVHVGAGPYINSQIDIRF